jgi:hypothetical protein
MIWWYPEVGSLSKYKLIISRDGPHFTLQVDDFQRWAPYICIYIVSEYSKGQTNLKLFFQADISSKKTNKRIRINCYDTSGRLVFVHFLEEIEDTEKTFRNWLTFSTYLEYISLLKGSRAKSKSPCAFRRKRRRKSKSSRGKPKG